MPKITVGDQTIEADHEQRLILALRDADVDILHRCGGYAKCTTCRVTFQEGEPNRITQAELDKLQDQGDLGNFRLSCQIACTQDMSVTPLLTLASTGLDDRGQTPQDDITPQPEWTEKPDNA
jgi:ferredoxin